MIVSLNATPALGDEGVATANDAAPSGLTVTPTEPVTVVASASVAVRVSLPAWSSVKVEPVSVATPSVNVTELDGYDGATPEGLSARPDQVIVLFPV